MAQTQETFQIEEYKLVYKGIIELERSINQLFAIAIATSATILSAVGTFFFKIEAENLEKLSTAYAFPFLGPLTILIPVLFILVSHRRGIFRSGTYIRVFYEEKDYGPLWETRLSCFREKQKGESLDVIPYTFWAISIVSMLCFLFALYSIIAFTCDMVWVIAGIIIVVAFILMAVGHMKFHDASRYKQDYYYNIWKDIRNTKGISGKKNNHAT